MIRTSNSNTIDVMKFICAILVVIIHAPPLLSYSETANFILVDIIARIAVPFFFVCAGYFFFNKIDLNHGKIEKGDNNVRVLKKYVFHLINIYAFWTVFYLIWWIPLWYNGGNLTLANMKGYFLSIFLSGSFYHLWYIVALIYGMAFAFYILIYVRVNQVIITAIIFYLIGTFAYSYTWIAGGNLVINQFIKVYEIFGSVSVGLFRAFPYLIMGLVFSKYRIKITTPMSGFLSSICLILLGLEVWFLKTSGHTSKFSYVILTGFTVFFIFNSVIRIKLNYNASYPLLRKMSSIIYFVHPMFININGSILLHYFSNENSVVLFCSVLVSILLFSVGLIRLSHFKHFSKVKSVY